MAQIRTVAPEVRLAADYFELRAVESDGRYLEGVAAPLGSFRDIGPYQECLDHSVFDRTLEQRGDRVPLMVSHESAALPVGKPVSWEKSDSELRGVWRFDTRAEAREAHRLASEGYLTGLSVGFAPGKNKGDTVVEKRGEQHFVTRKVARLLEVSLVAVPAYEDAGVIAVRTAGVEPLEELVVTTVRRDAAQQRLAELDAMLASLPKPLA